MTEWFVDHDWHYFHYPLEEPDTSFPGFEEILSLWRAKGGEGLPAWSGFDFSEFGDWQGRLSVYDVISLDEPRFGIRLLGIRISDTSALESSNEGLSPASCPGGAEEKSIGINDLLFAATVCRMGRIGRMSGREEFWRGGTIFHELYLPLSSDGETIDQVMLVNRREHR